MATIEHMNDTDQTPHIGTLNEKSLHAQIKEYLAVEGDQFEVPLKRSVIDIVRGEQLIEVQTRNLGAMKGKLKKLLPDHPLHLVHPITAEKWLVRHPQNGHTSRRKSPKKENLFHIFSELVYITPYLKSPNLSLEILIIQEEAHQQPGKAQTGRWPRKWHTAERQLLTVLETHRFQPAGDIVRLLPPELAEPFTTADLAKALKQPRKIAQKMAYTLYHADLIGRDGKRGRAHLYRRLP